MTALRLSPGGVRGGSVRPGSPLGFGNDPLRTHPPHNRVTSLKNRRGRLLAGPRLGHPVKPQAQPSRWGDLRASRQFGRSLRACLFGRSRSSISPATPPLRECRVMTSRHAWASGCVNWPRRRPDPTTPSSSCSAMRSCAIHPSPSSLRNGCLGSFWSARPSTCSHVCAGVAKWSGDRVRG
jgi:hypothetical protein